jgi:signal transduction histidine kinase/DNA-binding response OmpR family regulator
LTQRQTDHPQDWGTGAQVLAGGGELGALIRAHDWAATPLGPPEGWPLSLKTAIRIMLTSRQPFWIGWGKDLIYFYNDAYKSIIGGKHPWALGRPTSEVWREIWSEISPLLATAMRGDEGIYVEQQLLIMERNGYPEETYYTYSYSPIPNDDGSVGGMICANTDDTQRVIGERQVALLRELAAGVAEARNWREACELSANALATDPRDVLFALIYMAEPDSGHVALASACGITPGSTWAPLSTSAEDQSVWPVQEVLSKRDVRVISGFTRDLRDDLPTGAWKQPAAQVAVLPVVSAGESARAGALVVGLNPFRLFDDNYRGFLGLVAGQIAAGIANADAYEQERRRAESLAELDRAKTAFFSNVSHEFRTPLTLMLGPLEDMLSAGDDPTRRESVEVIHRNGLRLLKLVNSLLDFARIEAGRTQARYEPLDLARLTADLASNFHSLTERAGLKLIVDCQRLSEPAYVDREKWEKIVLNLLSNAFKFTFEGEIAVALRETEGSAVLTVRDTGIGIPEQSLSHVFERFHRIEGARGRSYEGSGIGLALVQELVKLHGGAIEVESAEGRGTAFRISIPLGAAHLPAQAMAEERRPVSTAVRALAYIEEAARWIGSEGLASGIRDRAPPEDESSPTDADDHPRILVADDNADMRDYVCRLLGDRYDVHAAADGQAALEALRAHPFELVLTDIMMPRLDGFELLQAIRNDPALRDLPVIVLSARAGEAASLEGLSAGADDYLVKPFSARELIARTEGNIKLARIRRENARMLEAETEILEKLNKVGTAIAAEIDLERAVQVVTDAATELSGAQFGSFFYNVINAQGESYMLYTLSGVPREAFANFPMPRNTAVFAPTFNGEGIVRSADITKDPRHGKSAPHYGMPKGHLPVRSYLAAPVISHSGEVLGGLFFGHSEVGVFDERAERLLAGIAIQAAIAIDKARLYRSAQNEIEQRKRTEETLRETEQMLESKVAERTAQLVIANDQLRAEALERERVEEQLRQAQKMEAIGQLTGGVAHDFNNLLTIVIGNVDSLRRHLPADSPPRFRRSIENAMEGARRAATLTQQMLAFSRRQPLEPKATDINKLISGMSHLLGRAFEERIDIQTVLAGGLWIVEVDPNQLETAILNLAVNARDAMEGNGKLTIETANAHLDEAYAATAAEVIPGQYVVIAVSDTGAGMSKDIAQRAFEPFFTTKAPGAGTGLGLSQVYGFVKQSGGHVRIYSEVGQGTTVKIYLPRFAGELPEEELPEMTTPDAHGQESILVVEDDAGVRSYSVEILRELGYRIIEADSGATALRRLQLHDSIVLLFTDVGLPDMTGRQLADEALKRRPGLKVLFTTGYARNAIVHHGRLDSDVEMIGKPFTYADLAAKIRSVIDETP